MRDAKILTSGEGDLGQVFDELPLCGYDPNRNFLQFAVERREIIELAYQPHGNANALMPYCTTFLMVPVFRIALFAGVVD